MAAMAATTFACSSMAPVARPALAVPCCSAQRSCLNLGPRPAGIQVAPRPSQPSTSRVLICRASAPVSQQNGVEASSGLPKPVVQIDNHSDPFATLVTIQYGDQLGELLDTVAALKNLKLNISRAKLKKKDGNMHKHKFYLTDLHTSEKILKSARLEEIRLTIFNNLMLYHPESEQAMAWGPHKVRKPSTRDVLTPLGPRNRVAVKTKIKVFECDNGTHSEVYVETTDRPGLLVDIVKLLKDISVNVISAEVDTEGPTAKDSFYVTYHGEPLPVPMAQLVTNTLQYHLSLADVDSAALESY